MSAQYEEVQGQLYEELSLRLSPILGLDPSISLEADGYADHIASMLARSLMSPDPREVAQAAVDIGCALWPGDVPIPDEWWTTPAGRLCAASLAGTTPLAESVRPSVAARMLGVSQGRVTQLADEGKLDRHPGGGILLSSVYQRIGGHRDRQ